MVSTCLSNVEKALGLDRAPIWDHCLGCGWADGTFDWLYTEHTGPSPLIFLRSPKSYLSTWASSTRKSSNCCPQQMRRAPLLSPRWLATRCLPGRSKSLLYPPRVLRWSSQRRLPPRESGASRRLPSSQDQRNDASTMMTQVLQGLMQVLVSAMLGETSTCMVPRLLLQWQPWMPMQLTRW
jgi:hypothetical protein